MSASPAEQEPTQGHPQHRLRVSFVTPLLGSDGGVAAHVLASARALRDDGHEVTVICGRADPVDWPGAVSVVPELGEDGARAWKPALGDALAESTPDIVHIHDLARRRTVELTKRFAPTVVSAHAYPGCSHNNHYFAPGDECTRAHGPGCLAHMAFRGCLHARNPLPVPRQYRDTTDRLLAYELADEIVGYSNAVLRHLRTNGLEGRLVPLFTPLRTPPETGPSADRPAREVLFVGRVVPPKGLHTLLDAVASLDARLTVVGDGWQRPASEARASRLGIATRVRFAGWLAGEDLLAAYVGAAVVAVPSLWPEPFGLVGIEAMSCGRPVVASLTGGIGDWLEPEVTGLGVDAGNASQLAAALARVLDDGPLQRSMGRAGRESVGRRFNERAHVGALDQLYRAAVARRHSQVPTRLG